MDKQILPATHLDNIKMIITDLDGTALRDDKDFSSSLLNAIKELKKRKIKFVMATGRPVILSDMFCALVNNSKCPLIALEGAVILDWETKEVLFQCSIPHSAGYPLVKFLIDSNYDCTFHKPNKSLQRPDSSSSWRYELYNKNAEKHGLPLRHATDYSNMTVEEIASDTLLKVFVSNVSEADYKRIASFISNYPELVSTVSEENTVTIMMKDASKAKAVDFMLKKMNIQRNEVCCFGDMHNDIGMLSMFKNSVAMSNAADEVKKASSYVTCSNNDDGVAWFIERYIL